MQVFQAATTGGSGNAGASVNNIMGDTVPRGRGFDERAARAAAEVRKKAAARGILIRPHGLPAQAYPPLNQLLNVINSGMTPDANGSGVADAAEKKEANNGDAAETTGTKKNGLPVSGQQDEAPAGLGKGLSSLEAKKQKAKPKVAS